MKTSVIMQRDMGGLSVQQRTKDGMFNASFLLREWNTSNNFKGRKGKRVEHFLELASTKKFLNALQDEINSENEHNPITRDYGYLKTYQKTRGKNGGTWMHPYLFIDFAMWINPKFKVSVLKFVHDQLIENRNNAGDNYIKMQSSVGKLKGCDFAKVAQALNYIVFGKHTKGLRQLATQDQLIELNKIQGNLSFAIESGFIKTFPQLINHLRKMWTDKNTPKILKSA